MNFWTPPKDWSGQDAFLIGGGPSLKGFDFSCLAGKNTIGCNDAFHLGPGIVKFCVFGDAGWWHRNKWQLEKFAGQVVTNAPGLMNFAVPYLLKMKRERDGIHVGDTLGWNYSTGAMAINLAVSLGAARIFLLGYDLGNDKGSSHWHSYNPNPIRDSSFDRFLKGFKQVKATLPPTVNVCVVTDGATRLDFFNTIRFEHFQSIVLEAVPA